jgi:hypothetical protein
MQKINTILMVCNAVLWPLVGIVTLWQARLSKRKSHLIRGFSYVVMGLGWGLSARWPDPWAWGIPVWMLVLLASLHLEDWADKVDGLTKQPPTKS